MPRTRSAKHLDDTVSTNSSPDPLGLSYDGSPVKPAERLGSATPTSRSQPLQHRSPNTTSPSKLRNSFTPSTPVDARRKSTSRSVTLHTPNSGTGASSPWKIRVTVEAEPEDQISSPTRTRTTTMGRTKTTTIPLKGADESTPAKKRGRPRKTDTPGTTPASGTKRKRPGTPVRPRSRSSRGASNDEIEPQISESNVSLASNPEEKHDTETEEHSNEIIDDQVPSNHIATAAVLPKRKEPPRTDTLEDLALQYQKQPTQNTDTAAIAGPAWKPSKGRAPTPVKPHSQINFDDMSIFAASPRSNLDQSDKRRDPIEGVGDIDQGLYDDTAVLDRSAVESEGFSMVSIESLRSQQARNTNKNGNNEPINIQTRHNKHLDPAFGAFGEHTQKGLRASLMMGELLARGEKDFMSSNSGQSQQRKNAVPQQTAKSSQTATFARLPTPSESNQSAEEVAERNGPSSNDASFESSGEYDAMSWRATTPHHDTVPQHTSSDQMSWKPSRDLGNSHDHQTLELYNGIATAGGNNDLQTGEASPHQHQANTGVTENLEDIWQEEADRSLEDSRSSRRSRSNIQTSNVEQPILPQSDAKEVPVAIPDRTPDWNDLLEEDSRPLRAKLPRTWRRVSGNDFLYSDESQQDDEDSQIGADEKTPKRDGFSSVAAAFLHQTPHTEPSSMVEITKPTSREPTQTLKSDSDRLKTYKPPKDDERYFSSEESSIYSQGSRVSLSNNFQDGHDKPALDRSISSAIGPTAAGELDISMSASSILDTSDVRQLKWEMNNAVGLSSSSDGGVDTTLDQSSNISEVERSREERQPTIRSIESVTDDPVRQYPASCLSQRSKQSVETRETGQYSLLNKIFSIFWSTTPKPVTDLSPGVAQTWTRNHYLLLDRIFRVSQEPPRTTNSRKRKRNSLYVSPVDEISLPHSLSLWIGHRLSSADAKTQMVLDESHVRVIHSFIVEAREKGIPLMCNGKFTKPRHSNAPRPERESFPQRDDEGRIMRIKESWSPEDVGMRLFSLWVADYKP